MQFSQHPRDAAFTHIRYAKRAADLCRIKVEKQERITDQIQERNSSGSGRRPLVGERRCPMVAFAASDDSGVTLPYRFCRATESLAAA